MKALYNTNIPNSNNNYSTNISSMPQKILKNYFGRVQYLVYEEENLKDNNCMLRIKGILTLTEIES